MALMSSMYAGWSGLTASSTQLSVIGDNIANGNTIGFKGSRAMFEEALAQTMMGAGHLGMGTRLQAIQRILSQGAIVQTGVPTDLALDGEGFFMLRGTHGGITGNYYTRAGQFTVDNGGYLVNLDGLRVQGFLADPTGQVGGTTGDLLVGDAQDPPVATTTLTLRGNLDAEATAPTAAWDPAAPALTGPSANANFMQPTTIYDSLGNAIQVDVYYRKTAAGAWEFHAVTDGAAVAGGTAGTTVEIGNGTLTYDTNGNLTAMTQTSTFSPVGATAPQPLTFNFGSPTGGGGTGADGITQYAGASTVTFIQQDGHPAGALAAVQVDTSGNVTATFTNGETRVLAQLVVASFSAADQMQRLSGNLYGETAASGPPQVGVAATGGRGSVLAGALEQSNVDLAEEFINMIGAQRAFQANSKTISTADQMLQELMTLKR
ncbi:MAG: flagellar hook protein FlgE [Deltaproteobacteria bacterium]|nr:flagellar hook protein FlgE [Deltaproteobacteria bacterium]